jgi:hypothetical protein
MAKKQHFRNSLDHKELRFELQAFFALYQVVTVYSIQ